MAGGRLPTTTSSSPLWSSLYREGVILNKQSYSALGCYQEKTWAVIQRLDCALLSKWGLCEDQNILDTVTVVLHMYSITCLTDL